MSVQLERNRRRKNKIIVALVLLVIVAAVGAYIGWDRGFREHPQPDWVNASAEARFKYGSIGAEADAGIPYWIFYVLPRMFPDKLPGPGGYAVARRAVGAGAGAAGRLHQESDRLSARGATIARSATPRPTAQSRTRTRPSSWPVPRTRPTWRRFFRFLVDCAKDPRFNADTLMREINLVTELDLIDKLLYRFFIIPITKKRLLEREAQFAWIYRKDFPDWGRGSRRRDEPHQVLHDQDADGRHLRSHRHAVGLEPAEIQTGERHVPQPCRRQPRSLFGHHGFGDGPARRRAEKQG